MSAETAVRISPQQRIGVRNAAAPRLHGTRCRLNIDVLSFPVTSGLEFTASSLGNNVVVGPLVDLSFVDQAVLNECVKVGVQASVVNFCLIVVFEFVFNRKPVRFVEASCDGEEITLEPGEIVHVLRLCSLEMQFCFVY